ncbi:PREDICTED: putative lung carcinoma-associated protein 10 [Rhinopithecus bieti]|uniref:putative lung carcinoma-associated protein 10 n=1 Tax=Rhinopithecus bieti TaxID=61621 RepID=UPI00083BD6B8|nr:PREDICTED: putative lung carcinoma-associated protein 10 [Rhinopithecus bieti]
MRGQEATPRGGSSDRQLSPSTATQDRARETGAAAPPPPASLVLRPNPFHPCHPLNVRTWGPRHSHARPSEVAQPRTPWPPGLSAGSQGPPWTGPEPNAALAGRGTGAVPRDPPAVRARTSRAQLRPGARSTSASEWGLIPEREPPYGKHFSLSPRGLMDLSPSQVQF